MQIKKELDTILQDTLKSLNLNPKLKEFSPATKVEFGDFQYNGAMGLAKELKQNPRAIATTIANELAKNPIFSKVEIAGPGFINVVVAKEFLQKHLLSALNERAGANKKEGIRVVVDYSSPNMAKQMHVGHLRSTIIGDALANLFEFLGDEVIRQNHIGDWGTQFGMLIAYFEEQGDEASKSLSDLEEFYKAAKKRFDEDENFAKKAREYVVKLQSGDEGCLKLWKEFIDITLEHCQEVYDKLGVGLDKSCVRGESAYNESLPKIVELMKEKDLAKVSQGATCIFFEDKENPLIIQKADGGYLYATTDLAAIKYRVEVLKAKRICYVVDARQSEHFELVFKAARMANIAPEDVLLEHIAFGMVLDKSGKPFKTREGGTVKLIDLINEAVKRAKNFIKNKEDLSQEEIEKIAKVIGVGSLKYADLSINRTSNYIFDWDKMLSLEGNTALYMQYAYARINSILKKANSFDVREVILSDEIERRLALKILSFEDVLLNAYKEAMPHLIAAYLYDLATLFTKFYENNPILKEGIEEKLKNSRLILAKASANVIKTGLKILGIEVLERI